MTLLLFDAIIISFQDSSVVGTSVAITFKLDIAEKDDWLYSNPCAGSAYLLFFLFPHFFKSKCLYQRHAPPKEIYNAN